MEYCIVLRVDKRPRIGGRDGVPKFITLPNVIITFNDNKLWNSRTWSHDHAWFTFLDPYYFHYIWLSCREWNPSRYTEEVHLETKCNLSSDGLGKHSLQIRFQIERLMVCQHCLNVLTCCLAASECVKACYWPDLDNGFAYKNTTLFWSFRTLWNIREDVCRH